MSTRSAKTVKKEAKTPTKAAKKEEVKEETKVVTDEEMALLDEDEEKESDGTASMDTGENGAEADDSDVPEEAIKSMTIEQLQAELMKRTGSKTSAKADAADATPTEKTEETTVTTPKKGGAGTKWVKYIDYQDDNKMIKDLNKLNKLHAYRQWRQDMAKNDVKHRVRFFPLTMEELNNDPLIEIIKTCITSSVQFRSNADGDLLGMLVLLFRTVKEAEESVPKMKELNPEIHTSYNETAEAWRKKWDEVTTNQKPGVHGNLSDCAIMLPSLPDDVSEEDLWDYFPSAVIICLVEDEKTKNHAFIDFVSEENAQEAVKTLNSRGRVKDSLKFCGVVRMKRLFDLAAKDKAEKAKAKTQSATPSRPTSAAASRGRGSGPTTRGRGSTFNRGRGGTYGQGRGSIMNQGRGGFTAPSLFGPIKRGAMSPVGAPPMKRTFGGGGMGGDYMADSWDSGMGGSGYDDGGMGSAGYGGGRSMGMGGGGGMGMGGGGGMGMGGGGGMDQSTNMKLKQAMEKLAQITNLREGQRTMGQRQGLMGARPMGGNDYYEDDGYGGGNYY